MHYLISQGKIPKRHPSQSQAMKALLVIHLRTTGVVQACQHFYHFDYLIS